MKTALRELVTLRRGNSYQGALVGEVGAPLLGLGTIAREGGFKGSKLRHYPEEFSDRIAVKAGDVYVSLKDMTQEAALLGAAARVPDGFDRARLTQDTIAVDILEDAPISRSFLYWTLRSPQCRAHCKSLGTGTTNLDLGRDDFLSYEFWLPSTKGQKLITEVLGALDDKIAANRRVVEVCDKLRSQLWNRACASDRSEMPLGSLARFVNGRAFTKDASGTGRIVIRIADLNSGIGASTVRNDIQVADDHVAGPGDLLLAWSGSLTSARWFREEAIVNQHIFKVIPNSDSEMWAVASAVDSKLADFKEIAKDKATTMGHIRRADLDQPVGWPAVSAEVGEAGQTLWSRALSAEMENEVLARTRDELLPLLMNGRITVKDAEQAAEAVL